MREVDMLEVADKSIEELNKLSGLEFAIGLEQAAVLGNISRESLIGYLSHTVKERDVERVLKFFDFLSKIYGNKKFIEEQSYHFYTEVAESNIEEFISFVYSSYSENLYNLRTEEFLEFIENLNRALSTKNEIMNDERKIIYANLVVEHWYVIDDILEKDDGSNRERIKKILPKMLDVIGLFNDVWMQEGEGGKVFGYVFWDRENNRKIMDLVLEEMINGRLDPQKFPYYDFDDDVRAIIKRLVRRSEDKEGLLRKTLRLARKGDKLSKEIMFAALEAISEEYGFEEQSELFSFLIKHGNIESWDSKDFEKFYWRVFKDSEVYKSIFKISSFYFEAVREEDYDRFIKNMGVVLILAYAEHLKGGNNFIEPLRIVLEGENQIARELVFVAAKRINPHREFVDFFNDLFNTISPQKTAAFALPFFEEYGKTLDNREKYIREAKMVARSVRVGLLLEEENFKIVRKFCSKLGIEINEKHLMLKEKRSEKPEKSIRKLKRKID